MSAAVKTRKPRAGGGRKEPAAPNRAGETGDLEDRLGSFEDLVDRAKTVAFLLCYNFGDDSSTDQPGDAPGMHAMVDCVASSLRRADKCGKPLTSKGRAALAQAAAIAEHMQALAQNERFNGDRGFLIAAHMVSMCYWVIEQLVDEAIAEVQQ